MNVSIPTQTLPTDATAPLLIAEIDRDALDADNTLRRPLAAREALRVGLIARRSFSARATADRLEAADWLRLAAHPSLTTPVDVVEIEPTSIDAPSLSGLDAVLAPSPDLINPVGWQRLRAFADSGGLVIVFPPADATVNIWPDDMEAAMETGWRLAREPATPALSALSAETSRSAMFTLLAGEIEELLRPVRVERALLPEAVSEQTQTLLTLASGEAWMIGAPPGVSTRDEEDPTPGRGLVVYMASSPTLAWTNLPAMPLMVPLLQEVLRQGVGGAAAAQMTTAGAIGALPPRTAEIRTPDGGVIAVRADGTPQAPLRRAGVHRLLDETGGDRGPLAVNPDTDAGGTDAQRRDVVEEWLRASGVAGDAFAWLEASDGGAQGEAIAARAQTASGLSLPLLLGALAFALLEVALASVFSHAAREHRSAIPTPEAV